MTISRDEAIQLLRDHIRNERMVSHCLASEAVMKALARRLGQDESKWGLAGLLHDLDVEMVNADLKIHGLETEKILREKGVDPEIVEAVLLHNEIASGFQRSRPRSSIPL